VRHDFSNPSFAQVINILPEINLHPDKNGSSDLRSNKSLIILIHGAEATIDSGHIVDLKNSNAKNIYAPFN
jgi:hypothetical protein